MIKSLVMFFALFGFQSFALAAPDYYWVMGVGPDAYFAGSSRPPCENYIASLGAPYAFKSADADTVSHATCYATYGGSGNVLMGNVNRLQCSVASPNYVAGTAKNPTTVCSAAPPPRNCAHPAGEKFRFGLQEGYGPLDGKLPTIGTFGYPTASSECNLKSPPDIEACYSTVQGTQKKYYCVYSGESAGTVSDGDYNIRVAPTGAPGSDAERSYIPPRAAPKDGLNAIKCPGGSVMAGLNSDGVPMCVGTGTLPPAGAPAAPPVSITSSTVSNPDGSTTVSTNTVTTNPDGSKTTVTDRVTTGPAPAGGGAPPVTKDQTKVTSATPGGAAGTEAKPADLNFCKQNPTLSICRESSVSGNCAETSCMGDAVQCATMRATRLMQCQQEKDMADLKALPQSAVGGSILAGADPMKGEIDAVMKGAEVDLSKPNLDQVGFLGGGSCFPNKTFTVMGKPVTMDFVGVCQNIQPLRNVVLACSFIIAYLIVSRSALSS